MFGFRGTDPPPPEERLWRKTPQIDEGAVGVSFVDLLFALAVTQVFSPVADWALNPRKNPLPAANWWQLALALSLTITSWIGYHASANKAHFKISFFNVEFFKLTLDIAMVAAYFALAAYADRQPVEIKREAALVAISFVLYLVWDLATAYQKTRRRYCKAMQADVDARVLAAHRIQLHDQCMVETGNKVDSTPEFPVASWVKIDLGRLCSTAIATIAALIVYVLAPTHTPVSVHREIEVDCALFSIVWLYRVIKELLGDRWVVMRRLGPRRSSPERPQGSRATSVSAGSEAK